MSENYLLPTLSQEGWVQSTAEQADYLLSHFFTSLYSQTHLYNSNVASFQWIIQNCQGDMDKTVAQLKSVLSAYYGRYFDNVVSQVTYEQLPADSSQVNITLFVSFTDKLGKDFILGKTLEMLNSKISKIIAINNVGS
jgi:hypothetical protein